MVATFELPHTPFPGVAQSWRTQDADGSHGGEVPCRLVVLGSLAVRRVPKPALATCASYGHLSAVRRHGLFICSCFPVLARFFQVSATPPAWSAIFFLHSCHFSFDVVFLGCFVVRFDISVIMQRKQCRTRR